LYRQTAAFCPLQRSSLLGQAEEWENRAVAELEAYFTGYDSPVFGLQPRAPRRKTATNSSQIHHLELLNPVAKTVDRMYVGRPWRPWLPKPGSLAFGNHFGCDGARNGEPTALSCHGLDVSPACGARSRELRDLDRARRSVGEPDPDRDRTA